jgi:hypothetical protein
MKFWRNIYSTNAATSGTVEKTIVIPFKSILRGIQISMSQQPVLSADQISCSIATATGFVVGAGVDNQSVLAMLSAASVSGVAASSLQFGLSIYVVHFYLLAANQNLYFDVTSASGATTLAAVLIQLEPV